jgi:hypothetical protein
MGARWADLRTLAVAERVESLVDFSCAPALAEGPAR